jgi:LysM repeat protein
MMRRIAYIVFVLGFFLSSCTEATQGSSGPVVSSPQPTGLLTLYHTVTPSPVHPTATIEVTIPITPTPSPTPFLYTVKGDDTMLSIAFKFGITLDELQAANPTVDPHYMGEGLQLVIPIKQSTPEVLETPTAVAVQVAEPLCYRTGDGGAWCIVAIKNELNISLENLSVWIGLFDDQGMNFNSQTAYSALNILRPGETMPLMAYFSPPLPDQFQARGKVITGLEVTPGDSRYIDAQVSIASTEISNDGKQAVVRGEVKLPQDAPQLSSLWVLAVAYDSATNIVGVRKWKSDGETTFEIPVYSLAGAIDHVETLVEARP